MRQAVASLCSLSNTPHTHTRAYTTPCLPVPPSHPQPTNTLPSQVVAVSLHDVLEPRPLALPRYGGEIYIYAALVVGGVWLLSTAPLIIMLGVMVVSVLAAVLGDGVV